MVCGHWPGAQPQAFLEKMEGEATQLAAPPHKSAVRKQGPRVALRRPLARTPQEPPSLSVLQTHRQHAA